jgi:ribulose-bisphosphate carboxylase large chain
MERIFATYEVQATADEIERIARDIALEQTVEVPETLVSAGNLPRRFVGEVEKTAPVENSAGLFGVTVGYPAHLAAGHLPQLLNLLYGNISLKRGIRLVDLQLPSSTLREFRGPNHGVAGLRRLLGVHGRPLLATALKPRGSPPEALAALARDFALGGGDIVKDDHNLVDVSFAEFEERVARCQAAVEEANAQTGRRTLYAVNLMAPHGRLEREIECAVRRRVRAVLVSPLVLGLDTVRHLAAQFPFVVIAHPALAGAHFSDPHHGIDAGLMLGTLFRLAGCDISVYPNPGGRFSLSQRACHAIAERLRAPLGDLAPAWPAPAGGMGLESVAGVAEAYGPDTALLIGGALLGHSPDLRRNTEVFLDAIREHFDERLAEPEAPSGPQDLPMSGVIRFLESFSWEGRPPTEYKATDALPFRGVVRHELIGRSGERTAYDLRYFEVAPGGHTSLERHMHAHTVICLRGQGVLRRGETEVVLRHLDIATIGPMEVHQLRNEGDEPFGFFCLVDHLRDAPISP